MKNFPDFTNYGYQVSKELGRNLQGGRITYLASSLTSNKQVVIKEFRFAIADGSWSAFKNYQREISALKQLKHSQIPCYLNSFETESGFCLVTEYIDAPSLAERHIFTPEEVKKIAISVLEILVYLQNFQPPIIHRDIKPENILVDENLQVYLVDFGLARLRGGELALSSIAAGTPGFMPPEEMFNRPLTTGSDLYSLGATLICLLTGTRSVEVDRLLGEDYRFKFEGLVPNLHWRFTQWLRKMVELHQNKRYENAVLALQELKGVPVVGSGKIFGFLEDEVKVDGKFVAREIPVVGGKERFAFLEDEVRVNEKFIGVADKGEIFATRRGEIKNNKKVAGFVGTIVALVAIFSIGSVISLRDKILVKNQIPASHTLVKNYSVIERIQIPREYSNREYSNSALTINKYSDLVHRILAEGLAMKLLEMWKSDKSFWYWTSNCTFYWPDKYGYANHPCKEEVALNIKQLQIRKECINCSLLGANLENTNLENANLQGAFLVNANLQNANLKNANLKLTNLRRTSINEQTILNPKWRLVWKIVNNKYQDLNLKKADLSNAFLVGNLENIDLEGANLENSNLTNSILAGANLKNANLKGAKINKTTYGDSSPHLRQVNLENANLETADLIFSFLQDANLQGTNFRKAKLVAAFLENTNLKEANLENAWLELAILKNANLENANLKNANLKNADLTGANIKGADFTGANLDGATMPDGSIYNGKIDQ
ncbi:MAG: protein kinase [Okeania sp. SIO2C9]|uniref:serine/threonine-protein kinase n=1 Tax=Okeania sp. SIO2C9 TaxID=2607791 RepID=UPI0013C26649|nr:serine/threonine-protein kinase [Okeania sp. SIO2C9]NEQ75922.1 protein kinase [Okeania sp. SIO2C9]